MKSHQLINQTSGKVEYYTPLAIIEAARKTMGGIDLDPASSAAANKRVRARKYFDLSMDGMNRQWHGRVWLNHPFGRREPACLRGCLKDHEHHDYDLHGNAAWIEKLDREHEARRVTDACCITYAATSEEWFQPLLGWPQCFLCPRTNYHLPDGTIVRGVSKGSVVTYFGPDEERFFECFKELGTVKVVL